ncbi:MAG: 16S rRNA pseudouridine(516) synthase [Fibrobacter sp.]|jgi:16S rRNA pseudouridine516 synthase|nr:16S rRNA pseudouridine(516) synthase [Fibrobacter sp.]
MPELTLERLLSKLGYGSRKESRALVRMGLVTLGGKIAEDPFMILEPMPKTLQVNGEEIPVVTELYIMLHKPQGYECSHQPRHHDSVFGLLPERFLGMEIQCVGRLDVETSGLLLLSNQGKFIHQVESPKKGLLKKYRAELAREFTEAQKAQLLEGVALRNEKKKVQAKEIETLGKKIITISIQEGLYHQVRRMLAAAGNHVEQLSRLSIGNVALPETLAPGAWRYLTQEEIENLGG